MMENSSWCDSDIEWTLLPDSVKKIAISMLKEKVKNDLVNKVTAEKLDQVSLLFDRKDPPEHE